MPSRPAGTPLLGMGHYGRLAGPLSHVLAPRRGCPDPQAHSAEWDRFPGQTRRFASHLARLCHAALPTTCYALRHWVIACGRAGRWRRRMRRCGAGAGCNVVAVGRGADYGSTYQCRQPNSLQIFGCSGH